MAEQAQQENVEKKNTQPPKTGGRSYAGRRPRRGGGDREYDQRVLEIKRVARTVAGGKRMRFRALVVVGNRKGKLGIGVKKGVDVAEAINKAVNAAKKNVIEIVTENDTIPFETTEKFKSSSVFMKPAAPGTGVIAGGAVRQVLDLAGVKNILSKIYGSPNKINTTKATYNALKKMRTKEQAVNRRKNNA